MERRCRRCNRNPRRPGQRWCKACHADYMREHRPRYRDLTGLAKLKADCRVVANVAKRRGLLVPQPCEHCGSLEVEMHHDDYTLPLVVRWLCDDAHQAVTNATTGQQRP